MQGSKRKELEEYPDLSWNPDFGAIQKLVEILYVVGVKPRWVCLPI